MRRKKRTSPTSCRKIDIKREKVSHTSSAYTIPNPFYCQTIPLSSKNKQKILPGAQLAPGNESLDFYSFYDGLCRIRLLPVVSQPLAPAQLQIGKCGFKRGIFRTARINAEADRASAIIALPGCLFPVLPFLFHRPYRQSQAIYPAGTFLQTAG